LASPQLRSHHLCAPAPSLCAPPPRCEQYEMAQLRCTLPPPGNSSAYAPTLTLDGALQSHTGGFLELRLNQETFYPYAEQTGYKVSHAPGKTPHPLFSSSSGGFLELRLNQETF